VNDATLALIELAHHDELCAALGVAAQEVFLGEFADRVEGLKRQGDEAVKVMPHKMCVWLRGVRDVQQIELAAAKLERLFAEPISVVDEEIRARFHAAFVPPGQIEQRVAERLKVAEQGLREARSRQLAYVIKTSADGQRPDEDFKHIREVETGMERGEFLLHFQPKVHAGFRNITGAEALMRWHRPRQGLCSPAEFIPLAQRGGLLADLTWFAIKSAMARCRHWPSDLSVAVNVPPQVLLEPQLTDVVRDCLAIFGLAPERLTLEVTEDAMIERPREVMAIMETLRGMGIRLAIDDFGTGYSSLAYLRDLPVHELKIDRLFVRDMLQHRKSRGVVKSIIDLAHNLGLKVVAEGIEEHAAAAALQEMGCDFLQGFHFGKPMPNEAFVQQIDRS